MRPIKLWFRQLYAYPDMYFFSEVEEILEYKNAASGHHCALIRLKMSASEERLSRLQSPRPQARTPILVQKKDLFIQG